MNLEEKKPNEMALDDEVMESVTGGTEEYTFSDFFEDKYFKKEFVDNNNEK